MKAFHVKHKEKGVEGVAISDHYVPEVSPDGQSLIKNFLVGVIWSQDQSPAISYHSVGELVFLDFVEDSYEDEEEDEEELDEEAPAE